VSTIRGSAALHRAMRAALGLDQPVLVQYAGWMRNFFAGDLGTSYLFRNVPVAHLILIAVPRTLLLFLPGALFGFLLGITLGKTIAWKRGGWIELGGSLLGTAFFASFPPWLAFTLIQVFAITLRWFPAENIINVNTWLAYNVPAEQVIRALLFTFLAVGTSVCAMGLLKTKSSQLRRVGIGMIAVVPVVIWASTGWLPLGVDILWHLALPLATLTLLSFGETMLLMRSTMVDVLGEDHVLTARAKGIPDAWLRDRHIARLALLPVVSRFAVQLPLVLVGSFVLERIFAWRGVGMVLFQAIDYYDYPVILGILSVLGIGLLLAHIVVDVVMAWMDPRLREGSLRPLRS
jgi:peptide/nickel transport system permease protein